MLVFEPEDFQISLERQLKIRMINDEIDDCNNVEILQTRLKETVESLIKYQQVVECIAKRQIEAEVESWISDTASG
jgi:hypothetical protein